MTKQRILRINSLLKEVISEVLRREVHHMPLLNERVTIMRVETTNDFSFAKVYISVLGTDQEKEQAIIDLNELEPMLRHIAMKKVVMRHFPQLSFLLDRDLEKQLRIEELLSDISRERDKREVDTPESDITE